MTKVNQSDIDWTELDRGETAFRRKQLGDAADGDQLGCSLYEVPPGRRTWPYHFHAANEEAVYVLSGEGTIRLDGETRPLREGDYVALPADESGAHRIINDGDQSIRMLVLSTMNDPDITVYPDSEKFGVYAGSPPGGRADRTLEGYYRIDDDVSYWEGEEE